jgi:hypothetical protein
MCVCALADDDVPLLPKPEVVEKQVSQLMRSSRPDPPRNPNASVFRHAHTLGSDAAALLPVMPEDMSRRSSGKLSRAESARERPTRSRSPTLADTVASHSASSRALSSRVADGESRVLRRVALPMHAEAQCGGD